MSTMPISDIPFLDPRGWPPIQQMVRSGYGHELSRCEQQMQLWPQIVFLSMELWTLQVTCENYGRLVWWQCIIQRQLCLLVIMTGFSADICLE